MLQTGSGETYLSWSDSGPPVAPGKINSLRLGCDHLQLKVPQQCPLYSAAKSGNCNGFKMETTASTNTAFYLTLSN